MRRIHRWWPSALLATAVTLSCASPASAQSRLDVNVGGWAENSTSTPSGDVLVSNLTRNEVQRIDAATRTVTRVVALPSPGGLAVRGGTLFVAFGNTPLSAVTDAGGVARVDLASGRLTRIVTGSGEVNGLDVLPAGDVIYSVTAGRGAGVHRVDPDGRRDQLLTASVVTPNGLAVGPDGFVYVGSTATGTLTRIDSRSGASRRAAGISVAVDDFGFLTDGRIVAATTLGQLDVIDLRSGKVRPFASGRIGATSAKHSGSTVIVTTVFGRVSATPPPA